MEDIQLVQLGNSERIEVIRKLGFDLDSKGYIFNKKTSKYHICKYSGQRVHINTAAILPGSVIIINATPITMAEYFLDLTKEIDG